MKVVILGAGISGHTAALSLRKKLARKHEIIVISPNEKWNWIPSNIWVGVGELEIDDVTFPIKNVYDRQKITFHQARAIEIYPEGTKENINPHVIAESTLEKNTGEKIIVEYDYLINATGPKLNFSATPGLGPDANSFSVCTPEHAYQTSMALKQIIEEMQLGQKKTFVIGMGHGLCTCEGAAFEYIFNLEFELRFKGVRDKARLIFITNEVALGDFGVGGMKFKNSGYITPSNIFAESLFSERQVDWILGAHVKKVDKNSLQYETLDGEIKELDFDFAMLLPPFTGVPLKAYNKDHNEINSTLFNAAGFMKVDGNYSIKDYDEWTPEDWPKTYQTIYKNIFAIGIAFAPPHQISKPRKSKNGTLITPAPPRTGMPSAIMGRIVANSIADMVNGISTEPTHAASMAEIGAACVASAGAHFLKGSAASMTMYPIIPDYKKYPISGRSLFYTTGEIGVAGHWIKKILHFAFIYKAKALPLWWLIPE